MYRVLTRSWRRRGEGHENGDAEPVGTPPSGSSTSSPAGPSCRTPLKHRDGPGRGPRTKFACAVLFAQASFLLLFAVFVEYDPDTLSIPVRRRLHHSTTSTSHLHAHDVTVNGEPNNIDLELDLDGENVTTPSSEESFVSADTNSTLPNSTHAVRNDNGTENNSDLVEEGFYVVSTLSPSSSSDGDLHLPEEDLGSGDVESPLSPSFPESPSLAFEADPFANLHMKQQFRNGDQNEPSVISFSDSSFDHPVDGPRSFLHTYQTPDPHFAAVYPLFQDVHVMMFIGFGFLMTFLKKYGYSAVGVNMLLAAVVLQWATLCQGFFHNHHGKIMLNITSLLNADFASATVLISFGALLGKTSPLQLLVMAIVEIVLFAANEWVGLHVFGTSDVGASVLVHVFGAYFGLMVSLVLHRSDVHESTKEGANYQSDIFAMIGTIFLWLFWPSFNGALAPAHAQHRVIINTYYSLAACCVTTFAISSLVDKHNRFNMVHVQNSTLAGGVAIGTSADLMVEPYGAMLVGISAAILSVLGYHFVTPFMSKRLRIHDTCGVHNLHGMPGVLAGIIGAIMASIASENKYGIGLYEQYPKRAPAANTTDLESMQALLSDIEPGEGWSASTQAGYQMVTLVVTLAVAIVGGLLTGLVLRIPFFDSPTSAQLFEDEDFWEVPEEEPLMITSHSQLHMKHEDSKQSPTNGVKDTDVLAMSVY